MTFLMEMTMYCTICGGPVWQLDDDLNGQSWLAKVLLLHKPAPTSDEGSEPPPINNAAPETDIKLIPARNKCGPYFILTDDDAAKQITACDVPTFTNFFAPDLYFPCHENCVQITEWTARARGITREKAWRKIQAVLKKQLEQNIDMNNKIQPVTNLANAGKYGTLWQIQELEWRSYLDGAERYEADPLDIPNLSDFLLRQLPAFSLLRPSSTAAPPQPINGDDDSKKIQAQASSHLPTTFNGFPIPPEKMHPILAHIWDFEQVPKDARARDWPRLMERMCSIEILEPEGGGFEDVPEGIRNQRRIWALVDDLLDAESG